MNVLIIGCGKVGSKLATIMWEEGHDVSIVDSNSTLFESLPADFHGITISGIPIDTDVLRNAGIEQADAVAAVTQDDNINIMVSQVAREIFKIENVVARIYNPKSEEVFHHFGLNTICPTNITVDLIKTKLVEKYNGNIETIFGSVFSYKEYPISKEVIGLKLDEIELDDNVMIFAVKRNNDVILANHIDVTKQGDIMVLVEKIK